MRGREVLPACGCSQKPMLALTVASALPLAIALDNGVSRTPPMGYNTWNDLGCAGMGAVGMMRAADALLSQGLAQLGYTYVIADDCWTRERNAYTGRLVPDPVAFPGGMQPVADYLHSRGLKFGLYTDRGSSTCEGRPGSEGNEALDAATFASWGVDYLKEDSCNAATDHGVAVQQYASMRDGLAATARPIHFALCGWRPWYAPYGQSLGNSWRISADVNSWAGVWYAAAINAELGQYASPGSWNDPDMLLGSTAGASFSLPPVQSRTQFSLWSVMAAPLILGAHVSGMSTFDRETYTNAEVIAIDQDPAGIQGTVLWEDCPPRTLDQLVADSIQRPAPPQPPNCKQVWAKRLIDGSYGVILVNWSDAPAWISVDAAGMQLMGFAGGARVRNLWTKAELGVQTTFKAYLGPSGDSALYKFMVPTFAV